jgi:hypothetical protein
MDSVGKPDSLLVRLRVPWVGVTWEPPAVTGTGFEGEVGESFALAAVVAFGGDMGEVGDCLTVPVVGNALIDKEDVGGRLRAGCGPSLEGGITTGVPGTNAPTGLLPNGTPVIAGETGADSVISVGRPSSATEGSRS